MMSKIIFLQIMTVYDIFDRSMASEPWFASDLSAVASPAKKLKPTAGVSNIPRFDRYARFGI